MVTLFGSKTVVLVAVLFAIGFEVACLFARFVLKKKSTQNTGFIGKCTCGLRIHHGYVGVLLVLVRNLFPMTLVPMVGSYLGTWAELAAGIGWGCIISDGIHHFWVLWPLTGSHDFDLVYPVHSFPTLKELEEKWRASKTFGWVGVVVTFVLLVGFLAVPR
ncbi:MAG: hypothetical protein V4674_03575 [Patescibacteria group bacterium]